MNATARLLLVDDDPVVRIIVHQSLLREGYEVMEAAHGLEAMAPARDWNPDLVLLDVVMPEMDGFAFCSWLRAQPFGAHVPVLMMTGLDDESSIQRAFEAGATDFITKSTNNAILIQRVRFLLRASQTLLELANSRESLAEAQRIARLGSWEMERDSQRMHWSDEVYRIFDTDREAFATTFAELLDHVHPDDRLQVKQVVDKVLRDALPQDCLHRLIIGDGRMKWMSTRCEPHFDAGGNLVGAKGTVQDVTERRQNEETIRYLSSYDIVTALPNRLMFAEHLERIVAHARRARERVALIHVGLDRFKRVNESFGHTAGDALLMQVAERLKGSMRGEDYIGFDRDEGTLDIGLARWSGDEFVVLLTGVRAAEDAARAARRILDALGMPYAINGQELTLSATMGIALFPGDGENGAELLKNADSALHHAKDAATGGYGFYTRAINEQTLLRLSMESALRKAIERDELIPYYQPKVDAEGRPVGAELLLRWQHPQLGLLGPDKFIDLAEECNLIVAIGEWVIAAATAQLAAWARAGMEGFSLAINLSPTHFRDPELASVLHSAKLRHGVPDGLLEIELTEGMLMDDLPRTQHILQTLKDGGMRLAIDDFGTGYSSLSYLTRFPIDVLKIDRSFIRGIPEDITQKNITRAIIALSHSLDLDVVAEGVETELQAQFLKHEGCDVMQGFLFSRPLPISEFQQWLDTKA